MNILEKINEIKLKEASNTFDSPGAESYFKTNIFCESVLDQYDKEVAYFRTLKKDSLDDSEKELSLISNTMARKVATLLELPEIEQEINQLLPQPCRETLLTNLIEVILKKDWSVEEKYEFSLRVCLGVLTEGVVTAPLDGLVSAKIDTTDNFPRLVFAGPIRAVGGTNLIYTLVLAEYLRKKLNLKKYVPTQQEIERTIVQIQQCIRKHPTQTRPSAEELQHIIKSCSIMIDGVETEIEEVPIHKKLPRIDKPRLRGSLALIFVEGFIIRGRKVLSVLDHYGLDQWSLWIKELINISKNYRKEGQRSTTDAKHSLTMGRPLISVNNSLCGLRLKIGRSPTVGLAGSNVTKELIDLIKFINVGSQLVINCPGKATTITGISEDLSKPIVQYKDNTIGYYEVGKYDQVKEILDLGQILICTGDFIEYNKVLPARDYCHSCWSSDTKNLVDPKELSEEQHLSLHLKYPGVKLYPYYALMIDALTFREYLDLRARIKNNDYSLTPEIELILKKLNLLGSYENSMFTPKFRKVFEHYLLLDQDITLNDYYEVLELESEKNEVGSNLTKYLNYVLRNNNKIQIPEKGYGTIYARVGRCEAVHISKVKPRPFNALVNYKSTIKLDSFWAAIEKLPYGFSSFNLRYCQKCNLETEKRSCLNCKSNTAYVFFCKTCNIYCPNTLRNAKAHDSHSIRKYINKKINYEEEVEFLKSKKLEVSPLKEVIKKYPIKPVTETGVLSYEPLIKGYLRSKRGLFATKDGTIRTTFCNATATHFTPALINTSVETLKTLGYKVDVDGKPLTQENQILPLKFNDAIISYATAEWLLKITKFIDELIVYYYNGPLYYNCKEPSDLIGILTQMLSPHTSNAVLGRVIGFTKNYCVYTHPMAVSCRRRDVDGDIDAIYLASDMIFNCSKKFIPEQKRGALMSVPITLTTKYAINELDKQILSLELDSSYYDRKLDNTRKYSPEELKNISRRYADFLGKEIEQKDIGYNVKNFSFDVGNWDNWYKDSQNTVEKLKRFIEVTEKITYLNKREVYMGLIEGHLIPDIIGNLNAFYRQDYRCGFCGKKYPKIPLSLKCLKCKVGALKPTVYPGMILKYYPILKYFESLKYLPLYLTQKIKVIELVLSSFIVDQKDQENPLKKKISESAASV